MSDIIVDGKKLEEEEFETLKNNPKVRLKEVKPNEYKTLQKLEG